MLAQNRSLEDVVLPQCAIGAAFALIGEGLARNNKSRVLRLELSDNAIDDKGFQSLATALQGLTHGVVHIDVAHNAGGKVGTAALARSLKLNAHNASTLVHLNLSQNPFDKEGSTALAAWLALPNPLRVLLLSNTQLSIDIVASAILRGCTSLEQLDLSGNRVRKEDSGALAMLLQSTPALHSLDLSRTQLPLEALEALLKAARQNPYLSQNFKLVVQDNGFGLRGAQLLAQLAPKSLTVTSLDLADNDFGDDGIAVLATALCNNSHVKHLNIDGCFKQSHKHNPEQRRHAVDCLKALLGSPCPLESLSMRGRTANGKGCAIGDDLIDFLYELSNNDALLALDISCHEARDGGAAALAKALLSNERLRSVALDDNGSSLAGFESVRAAMRTNFSLLNFAVPLNDYAACTKTMQHAELELVRNSLAEINRLVARNHAPAARYEAAAPTPSTAGTVKDAGDGGDGFTAAQGEVERCAQKVRSVGAALTESHVALLSDADHAAKDLWVALARVRDQQLRACSNDLRQQLAKCVADALLPTLARHKQEMVAGVMRVVQSSVNTMAAEDVRRLQMSVDLGASEVSPDEASRIVTERCTAEIGGKMRECFAAAADIALETVCEKLIDRMTEVEQEMLSSVRAARERGTATTTQSVEALEDDTLTRSPLQTPRVLNFTTLRRRRQSEDDGVDEEAIAEVDLTGADGNGTDIVEMVDLNDDELDEVMPEGEVPLPDDDNDNDDDDDVGDDDDDDDDERDPDNDDDGDDDADDQGDADQPPPPADEDDAPPPPPPEEVSPRSGAIKRGTSYGKLHDDVVVTKTVSPEAAVLKKVPTPTALSWQDGGDKGAVRCRQVAGSGNVTAQGSSCRQDTKERREEAGEREEGPVWPLAQQEDVADQVGGGIAGKGECCATKASGSTGSSESIASGVGGHGQFAKGAGSVGAHHERTNGAKATIADTTTEKGR
jgi:Ran GTPase-activating protein (RanGAP) involved in mRNA processing and transport